MVDHMCKKHEKSLCFWQKCDVEIEKPLQKSIKKKTGTKSVGRVFKMWCWLFLTIAKIDGKKKMVTKFVKHCSIFEVKLQKTWKKWVKKAKKSVITIDGNLPVCPCVANCSIHQEACQNPYIVWTHYSGTIRTLILCEHTIREKRVNGGPVVCERQIRGRRWSTDEARLAGSPKPSRAAPEEKKQVSPASQKGVRIKGCVGNSRLHW